MGHEHFVRLGAGDRTAVAAHLTALDENCRVLRFGTRAPDESVASYVAAIDFDRDIVEGVWDDEMLVGVAHLAVYPEDDHLVGELGISVLPSARHQHLGHRLLARTLLHARLKPLKRIYVRFLVRNRPMARLAREFTEFVKTHRGDALAIINMEEIAPVAA
jgi:RimJ/RimL family protein N-acetyltransferase